MFNFVISIYIRINVMIVYGLVAFFFLSSVVSIIKEIVLASWRSRMD